MKHNRIIWKHRFEQTHTNENYITMITTHVTRINRVLVTNIIITKQREIIVEIAKPQQEKNRNIG